MVGFSQHGLWCLEFMARPGNLKVVGSPIVRMCRLARGPLCLSGLVAAWRWPPQPPVCLAWMTWQVLNMENRKFTKFVGQPNFTEWLNYAYWNLFS